MADSERPLNESLYILQVRLKVHSNSRLLRSTQTALTWGRFPFPPPTLHQEISPEDALQDEVVFLVLLVEETFLQDGQLALLNAQEASLCLCIARLLSHLQLLIKEDFLSQGPPDVRSAKEVVFYFFSIII